MNFLYTIIIPHYNDLKYLKNLVSTIPVRDDIEIIIIDDNSEVFPNINEFIDRNIQVILNDSGIQSAGACRNIGLEKAKGKWLLFADADDYFTQEAFNVVDKYISSYVDIIYFKPKSICLQKRISKRNIPYCDLVDNYINKRDLSIRYRFFVPWSKLIRKELIDKYNLRFDEIIASNDINFSLKAGFYAKEIDASIEEVYCVTQGSNSLTNIINKEHIDSRFYALCRYNDFLIKNNLKQYQCSMSQHLYNTFKVDINSFFPRLLFSLRKRYPIHVGKKSIAKYLSKYV